MQCYEFEYFHGGKREIIRVDARSEEDGRNRLIAAARTAFYIGGKKKPKLSSRLASPFKTFFGMH